MSSSHFRNKLIALKYPKNDSFDITDSDKVKLLIYWLDSKVFAVINESAASSQQQSSETVTFETFCNTLKCPFNAQTEPNSALDWILNRAIVQFYQIHPQKNTQLDCFNAAQFKTQLEQKMCEENTSSLDQLDAQSEAFKSGVLQLAELLRVPRHPDHLQTLRACCRLICVSATNKNLSNHPPTDTQQKQPINVAELPSGLSSASLSSFTPNCSNALLQKSLDQRNWFSQIIGILRLLHSTKLRALQDDINLAIVRVQELISEPIINEALGQVGI